MKTVHKIIYTIFILLLSTISNIWVLLYYFGLKLSLINYAWAIDPLLVNIATPLLLILVIASDIVVILQIVFFIKERWTILRKFFILNQLGSMLFIMYYIILSTYPWTNPYYWYTIFLGNLIFSELIRFVYNWNYIISVIGFKIDEVGPKRAMDLGLKSLVPVSIIILYVQIVNPPRVSFNLFQFYRILVFKGYNLFDLLILVGILPVLILLIVKSTKGFKEKIIEWSYILAKNTMKTIIIYGAILLVGTLIVESLMYLTLEFELYILSYLMILNGGILGYIFSKSMGKGFKAAMLVSVHLIAGGSIIIYFSSYLVFLEIIILIIGIGGLITKVKEYNMSMEMWSPEYLENVEEKYQGERIERKKEKNEYLIKRKEYLSLKYNLNGIDIIYFVFSIIYVSFSMYIIYDMLIIRVPAHYFYIYPEIQLLGVFGAIISFIIGIIVISSKKLGLRKLEFIGIVGGAAGILGEILYGLMVDNKSGIYNGMYVQWRLTPLYYILMGIIISFTIVSIIATATFNGRVKRILEMNNEVLKDRIEYKEEDQIKDKDIENNKAQETPGISPPTRCLPTDIQQN